MNLNFPPFVWNIIFYSITAFFVIGMLLFAGTLVNQNNNAGMVTLQENKCSCDELNLAKLDGSLTYNQMWFQNEFSKKNDLNKLGELQTKWVNQYYSILKQYKDENMNKQITKFENCYKKMQEYKDQNIKTQFDGQIEKCVELENLISKLLWKVISPRYEGYFIYDRK